MYVDFTLVIDSTAAMNYTPVMEEEMKNSRILKAYELGFAYERTYRGCAQCTLAAVQDGLEIRDDRLFRAASSLASGGGLTCAGSCGGFSAGLMLIGSLFGRRREHFDNDDDFKYTAFRMGRELHDHFIETYGTLICEQIHLRLFGRTYDLFDSQDKQQFNDDGGHTDKCTSVVANAAAWTTELLLDELEKRSVSLEQIRKENT
jgi:hypothetical protein